MPQAEGCPLRRGLKRRTWVNRLWWRGIITHKARGSNRLADDGGGSAVAADLR